VREQQPRHFNVGALAGEVERRGAAAAAPGAERVHRERVRPAQQPRRQLDVAARDDGVERGRRRVGARLRRLRDWRVDLEEQLEHGSAADGVAFLAHRHPRHQALPRLGPRPLQRELGVGRGRRAARGAALVARGGGRLAAAAGLGLAGSGLAGREHCTKLIHVQLAQQPLEPLLPRLGQPAGRQRAQSLRLRLRRVAFCDRDADGELEKRCLLGLEHENVAGRGQPGRRLGEQHRKCALLLDVVKRRQRRADRAALDVRRLPADGPLGLGGDEVLLDQADRELVDPKRHARLHLARVHTLEAVFALLHALAPCEPHFWL
jgi:hypothetical protein